MMSYRRKRSLGPIAGMALAALLFPAASSAEPSKRLRAMTPASFSENITAKEDPLEHNVILSTEQVRNKKGSSPLHSKVSINHLRAIVDKRSGTTRYQVHQFIRYWGDRRDYVAVNFRTPNGLQDGVAVKAVHGADICPNEEIMAACTLTKTVIFEIDESTLRSIASGYDVGNRNIWSFKIKEKDGKDWQDAIVPAEAAGLLEATDRYRARIG